MGRTRQASKVELRRVTTRDANLFDRVAGGVFELPIDRRHLEDYLSAPQHCMIVALARGRIVGQVRAVTHRHPDKPAELAIDELAVAPGYRRIGIGRSLLAAMLDFGSALGCEQAWLGTDLHNAAARALYEPKARHGDPYLMYVFSLAVP
jgi:aminoglycoside 6'-N-acetyltransferase I